MASGLTRSAEARLPRDKDPVDRIRIVDHGFHRAICWPGIRNCNHIGFGPRRELAELSAHADGVGGIAGDHIEQGGRFDVRMASGEALHLGEKTELFIAGEAVGSQAQVDPFSQEAFDRKPGSVEIFVAARAVNNGEVAAAQKRPIGFCKHVHVCEQSSCGKAVVFEKAGEGRGGSCI